MSLRRILRMTSRKTRRSRHPERPLIQLICGHPTFGSVISVFKGHLFCIWNLAPALERHLRSQILIFMMERGQ